LQATKGACGEGLLVHPDPDGRENEDLPNCLQMSHEQGTVDAARTCLAMGHDRGAFTRWAPVADLEVTILQPTPGQGLTGRIERRHSPCGWLEPLPPD
jgi:hypothetical protein